MALPDMYALCPWACGPQAVCGPWAVGHTYVSPRTLMLMLQLLHVKYFPMST